MARPMPQMINCPNCSQQFNAILEQILDVGHDPTAKERLLSGRVNVVSCPHCGYQGMVGTPIFYHDPDHQMAIAYVPMELNLKQEEREKIIGDMTQAVMRAMPEDAPKGYLLQPKTALTMQGIVDQVLEADGITREMIEAERRKLTIVQEIADAPSDQVDQLMDEAEDAGLIDMTFLELLGATGQALSQQGENRKALRLFNLRSELMETTEVGRELKEQETALREASQELQALGDKLTRESFIDLIIESADNPAKVTAYATIGQGLLDYQTFQVLANRIESVENEERKARLTEIREQLLAAAAEYERQSQQVVERAVNTLRMLLSAPDIRTAIVNNIDRIDQTFLQVLQANLEEASKAGNAEVANRLKQIRDEVLALVQSSAPPEIRLINDLLSAPSDDEAVALLRQNEIPLDDELLAAMEDVSHQLRDAGNEEAARRMDAVVDALQTMM